MAAATIVAAAPGRPHPGRGDPFLRPHTDAERARWTLADLRTLGMALEANRTDNGAYPEATTIEEMVAAIQPF